jgi:hypothetical protein
MVAAAGASGAGSSMKIKGSMDTSNIDRGFARVGQGFDGVKGQAKSFGADMQRVAGTVGSLAKKLMLMGLAGTTAMVGIASKAPAVAPALAKMGISFGKISRSLGEALAPAFERVAGWLDKLAVWVDNNKEKIGEVATKFLDWAEAVGEKLWPWLEKIGTWAADNPGLFAGIVAGLALAPAVITGIASLSSLITLMTGATISGTVLAALGYIAAIGAAAYVGVKVGNWAIDKAQKYTGMGTDPNAPTDMSGETLMSRLPQKIWSDITGKEAPWEDPLNPNSPAHFAMIDQIKQEARQPGYSGITGGTGMISAVEDRRNWFLQWWDATWG